MTDITQITEKLDGIKAQYDAAVAAIRDNGGLKDIFTAFFEKNPQFKAISWTQYIPSFNDGDPCTFTISEPFVTTSDAASLDSSDWEYSTPEEEDDWDYAETFTAEEKWLWDEPKVDGQVQRIPNPDINQDLKDIVSFINNNEDLMEKLFGSYCRIIVTPEKILVEEYDCGY